MTKEPCEEEVRLFWGEAPPGSLKRERLEQMLSFIRRQRQLARIEALREARALIPGYLYPVSKHKDWNDCGFKAHVAIGLLLQKAEKELTD